jgi:nitrogen-specific signal transduction histidine kinase
MHMTSKGDYTDEEWIRLRRAPFVAGMAITIADPGGPIEMAKESFATLKAASAPSSQHELLVAVSEDIQSMAHEKKNPIGGFKPDSSALAAKYVLDELRAVNEVVSAKVTPEEADAFRGWLLDVAQASADAAKEGGFMSFGAELVSQGEQRMLDEVRSALGIT